MDDLLAKRILYTKGMAAACRVILGDPRMADADARAAVSERLEAYEVLIPELEGLPPQANDLR